MSARVPSEIIVTQAMIIECCIAVSAETRTPVAELVPTVADASSSRSYGPDDVEANRRRDLLLPLPFGDERPAGRGTLTTSEDAIRHPRPDAYKTLSGVMMTAAYSQKTAQ
jgi:hypothetical protein